MSFTNRKRYLAQAVASLVTAGVALGGLAGVARAATTDAVNSVGNCQTVVIKSTANQQYVSAELGYTGNDYAMLRARSASVGPWEQFSKCVDLQTGAVSFRSNANGLWVSAELTYGGGSYAELRARATSIGAWEQFHLVGSSGVVAIYSPANQQYVSTELNDSGNSYAMLRARSASVGAWEQFVVSPLTAPISTDSGWVSYDGGCQARTQVKYWSGSNVASVDTQVQDPYLLVACRVNATVIFDTPAGPVNGPTQGAVACAVTDPTCASSTDTGWQNYSNAFPGGIQVVNDLRVNFAKA